MKKDCCYPKMETLREELGYYDNKPVINAINELEEKGLIQVIRQTGKSNNYKLIKSDIQNIPFINERLPQILSIDSRDGEDTSGEKTTGEDTTRGSGENTTGGVVKKPLGEWCKDHQKNKKEEEKLKNKKEKNKKQNPPSPKTLFDVIPVTKTVIEYLNEKADRHYRADTKDNISLVENLIKLGYTVEQIKYVIDVKVTEWKNDSKMRQYLNPKTLFRVSNFDRYLNQPMPARQLSKTQKMEGIDYNDLDRLHKIQKTSKKTDIVF